MAYKYSIIAYAVVLILFIIIVIFAISVKTQSVPNDYSPPVYQKIPNNQYDYNDNSMDEFRDEIDNDEGLN